MSSTSLRYLSMLRMIPRYPRTITAPDLRDRLAEAGYEINLRTIQRDLESLSLDYPLAVDETSRPFQWSFDQSATANMIPALDVPEALTLELARAYLTPVLPRRALDHLTPHFEEARKTLRNPGHPMGKWPNRVRVITRGLMTARPEIRGEVLETVTEALLRDYQCELWYFARGESEPERMRVHPLGLVFRDPNVYLIAQVEGREGTRQLALHRAQDSRLLQERAARPQDFDLDLYIRSGAMGMLRSEEPLYLRLRCDKPHFLHLLESPLSFDQYIESENDDQMTLSATVGDTQDLRWWLMAQAAHLDILEPQWLSREIQNDLAHALARMQGAP